MSGAMERKRHSGASQLNSDEEIAKRSRQSVEDIRQYVVGFELEDLEGEVEEGNAPIHNSAALENLSQHATTSAMINVSNSIVFE